MPTWFTDPVRRSPRVLLLLTFGLAALVASACSSGDDGGGSGSASGAGGTVTGTPVPDLAGVRMRDLATGRQTDLTAALDAPPSTPVVAFFWAPY